MIAYHLGLIASQNILISVMKEQCPHQSSSIIVLNIKIKCQFNFEFKDNFTRRHKIPFRSFNHISKLIKLNIYFTTPFNMAFNDFKTNTLLINHIKVEEPVHSASQTRVLEKGVDLK